MDINNGELIWQLPTKKNSISENTYLLETSDIILNNEAIFLSNNTNKFFSINQRNGFINWEADINSSLRPSIVDNLIFTITSDGYLVILEKENGKIIRSNYIFNKIKKSKVKNIKPTGFIIGLNNIYVSTDKGYLIIIDITSGKSKSVLRISSDKISRPYLSENDLYILKSNGIIKFN